MYKILVIEEDTFVLDSIRELLLINGYNAITAQNGEQGIELAHKCLPDLIISDVTMPGISGFEVVEKLRKDPLTYHIPFLFLTTRVSVNDTTKGLMLGADDFILKPYRNDFLLNSIKSKIDRFNSQKKNADLQVEELRKNLTLSVPHEFRTPLNGILGFTNILRNEFNVLSDEDKIMMIEQVYESTIRLNKLISNFIYYADLLSKSKTDDEVKIRATYSPKISITEVMHRVAKNVERTEDIFLDLSDSAIIVGEHYFLKLIEELADNAFKFSKPGSRVAVQSRVVDEKYLISFSNSGRTLRPEDISKIGGFLQFDRNEYEQQGIGLGLAIVKKIIDIFEGSFSVDTRTDDIVTFYISFKLLEQTAGEL